MKKGGKLLCLFSTAIISVSAFTSVMPATAYYFYDSVTFNTESGDFTYTLKQDVEYGSIKIPYSATVTDIPNIKKVEIPEKVTYKGIDFTVTDIKLDDNLGNEFKKHNKIEEIVLPEKIYNISSFSGFPILKRMNIPKNTMIGRKDEPYYLNNDLDTQIDGVIYTDYHFYDTDHISYFIRCPKLKLSIHPDNPHYSYKNDFLLSKDGKVIYMSFNESTNIIIPDKVESIGSVGGNSFNHVNKIKFPNTLKIICSSVFPSVQLKKITFPDSLKEIWSHAFGASNLEKIKFGKNLTYIGNGAFRVCKKLKSVTLPKKLKKIDYCAFKGCKKLENVEILSTNTDISFQVFSRCSNLKSVTINGVKEIGSGTFYKCKKLSKVKIGNKKKAPKIEKRAFKNTKKGIKFYVKNKKVAKSLKKQLKGSGVRNAKILVGKKVIYKNLK